MTDRELTSSALDTLRHHDWYWALSEDSRAYRRAMGTESEFKRLTGELGDRALARTLRALWDLCADYYIPHIGASPSMNEKKTFEERRAALASDINRLLSDRHETDID